MEDHQLQILLKEMKKQTKYQKRIMNNVIFWFWLTMTVPLLYMTNCTGGSPEKIDFTGPTPFPPILIELMITRTGRSFFATSHDFASTDFTSVLLMLVQRQLIATTVKNWPKHLSHSSPNSGEMSTQFLQAAELFWGY